MESECDVCYRQSVWRGREAGHGGSVCLLPLPIGTAVSQTATDADLQRAGRVGVGASLTIALLFPAEWSIRQCHSSWISSYDRARTSQGPSALLHAPINAIVAAPFQLYMLLLTTFVLHFSIQSLESITSWSSCSKYYTVGEGISPRPVRGDDDDDASVKHDIYFATSVI